jgi:3,4-dehydroadipyl-CoA semialdehyde dehydrogenase
MTIDNNARGAAGQTLVLESYLSGAWRRGDGQGSPLVDPATGEVLAYANASGLDLRAALDHARTVGGPALRALDFAARAERIARIADVLQARRDDWYEIARRNSGNTKADAAIDVDGAIATLKYYAKLGSGLGAARLLTDGDVQRLGRDPLFQGRHVGAPLHGVAVHINAYNFPAWGLWGKAAVALLSGVPVLAKPATATAWLAEEMARAVIDADILPAGALSILCGSPGDLLDWLGDGDIVAFTGSAETGSLIRKTLCDKGVRLNIEADSLNAALLGPAAAGDSAALDLMAAEVVKEMTQKAGQKCTAIRRVIAPVEVIDELGKNILARLAAVQAGDPAHPETTIGPVVSAAQASTIKAQLRTLTETAADRLSPAEQAAEGALIQPTLLRMRPGGELVHDLEVFGPVATLIPYRSEDEAFALVRRGGGSLVVSVFSDDPAFLMKAASELASTHGRILLVDSSIGQSHSGHGLALPSCQHGGPGRAGDGAELGGLRALWLYHQRTALQASSAVLERLADQLADVSRL